jgi:hypothetical protein
MVNSPRLSTGDARRHCGFESQALRTVMLAPPDEARPIPASVAMKA